MQLFIVITSSILAAQVIQWLVVATVRWYNAKQIQKLLDEQEKHQTGLNDE